MKSQPPPIGDLLVSVEAIRDHLAGIVGIRYSVRAVEAFIAEGLPTVRAGRWRAAAPAAVATWARARWPDVVRMTAGECG